MSDELGRLMDWYAAQCNEVMTSATAADGSEHYLVFRDGRYEEVEEDSTPWQHRFGISIQTFDTPEWDVVIDLAETSLDGATMASVGEHNGWHDWYTCGIEANRFVGRGDPAKLAVILDQFLKLTAIR